jgi:hypothetical protein
MVHLTHTNKLMFEIISTFSRRGKLTDRILSKQILAPISSGYSPPSRLVEHLGLTKEMPQIQAMYLRHATKAHLGGGLKYLPFYHAIRERFPASFDWQVVGGSDSSRIQTILKKPYVNFVRPSLLTLLTCCARDDLVTTPSLQVRYPSTRGLPAALAHDLEILLKELSFYLPENHFMSAVADLLLKGLSGEEITLISPVCPDYGYVQVKDRFRYTFDQLGDGVGLVAGRIVNTLPKVQDLLTRHGIRSRLVIAAGDFEGFDDATVSRVRETRESFLIKVNLSQERVMAAIGRPVESVQITELAGGETAWRMLTSNALLSLQGQDMVHLMPTPIDLDNILEARLPLYQAWHTGRTRAQLQQVLLAQCAEYAAMGTLFHSSYNNSLVIGGDHNMMMPFYWLHQRIPVLYLKRVY